MIESSSYLLSLCPKAKYIIIIILSLISIQLESQSINYCDYFTLKVDVTERDGKQYFSYFTEVKDAATGKYAAFVKRHENRFTYLFVNKFDDLGQLTDLYPDTATIDSLFCQKLHTLDRQKAYFKDLSPGTLVKWTAYPATYTIDEMMMVASRFFHAEQVNQTDTTITSRICVGIHGLNSLNKERDRTLLEAFAFEAIFYNLLKNRTPLFDKNFHDCISNSLGVHKKGFVSYDNLLKDVRNNCYDQMSRDKHLKKSLLSYYRKNRSNLNFNIISY